MKRSKIAAAIIVVACIALVAAVETVGADTDQEGSTVLECVEEAATERLLIEYGLWGNVIEWIDDHLLRDIRDRFCEKIGSHTEEDETDDCYVYVTVWDDYKCCWSFGPCIYESWLVDEWCDAPK